ncbi:hypothetical protein GQ457_02G007770 [Hibiscus cannabinus]
MELGAAFVLAMIVCCHCLVFPAAGRPIKSTDGPIQSSQTEKSAMHEKGHQPAAVEGHGRLSFAGHRPGRKQVLPPPMPRKSSDFGVSVDGYEDAFRPTTPGNSPGAGHSFGQDDEETEQKHAGRVSSIYGDKDAFRPTTPGNSPAAGHSFGQDDEETEQRPAGRVSSINGDKEGFRPTNPGHSPGGGHAFVSKKSEPNA